MQDQTEFRNAAAAAIETLKQHLIAREDEAEDGFEVDEKDGVLNVVFAQPGGKFVINPNEATRQLSIAAQSTSLELEWNATSESFVLPRTGEALIPLVDRLIDEHRQP